MVIDTQDLRLRYVADVKKKNYDEFWVEIPGASNFAISNYLRVHEQIEDSRWHKAAKAKKACILSDVFMIRFDGESQYRKVSLDKLVRMSFMKNADGLLIDKSPMLDYSNLKYLVLNENEDENEILKFHDGNINDWLDSKFNNMRTRATNKKFKMRKPEYLYTTIADDWLNHPRHAKQYLLDISYYYPKQLEVDKDLLSLGEIDEYRPGNVILLPTYINNLSEKRVSKYGYGIRYQDVFFVVRTFDYFSRKHSTKKYKSYEDALQAARDARASHIHSIVEDEWNAGYLPEYILCKLEEMAELTREGKCKLREPDQETIKKILNGQIKEVENEEKKN